MSNFDFLQNQPQFEPFYKTAVEAEMVLSISPSLSAFSCRKAMECATRWIYEVEPACKAVDPAPERLVDMLNEWSFRKLIDANLYENLHLLRKFGNEATHKSEVIPKDHAEAAIWVLFCYFDWIDQFYGSGKGGGRFDRAKIQPLFVGNTASDTVSYETDRMPPSPTLQDPAQGYVSGRSVPPKVHPAVISGAMKLADKGKTKPVVEVAVKRRRQIDREALARDIESRISQPLPVPAVTAETAKQVADRGEIKLEKYVQPVPDKMTEALTRKLLIDTQIREAGWIIEGQQSNQKADCRVEVEVKGMPAEYSAKGIGFCDYVLYDNDGTPLAVIEAKKTTVGVEQGRIQAKCYADCLEKQHGHRPVIFLTNGYETRLLGDGWNERRVSGIYSKADLKWGLQRAKKSTLKLPMVDEAIAGRAYQKAAIQAICERFESGFRQSLLVMATGSGKTRTFMALLKVLVERGWVKHALFLADRTSLVRQAYKTAVATLPDISATNLTAPDANPMARLVCSTYQTMMGRIAENDKDEEGGKLFSCGHFDLIICDEAHRSIYKKYQDIFEYFDSLLLGMTATPKEDIDKNTYSIFNQSNGDPTFHYGLDQAVKEGYLVNYEYQELDLKFMRRGIRYVDLSPEEQQEWDAKFFNEDKDEIDADAVNKWLFNEDTVAKVLDALMVHGLRINFGNTVGKSIIFARNHEHAEFIKQIFSKKYPNFKDDYCQVIDNYLKFSDTAVEKFCEQGGMPQIAVSVDMLDTGIDIPECLNLIFFKPVYSRAKFWQMIGRGTRLCPNLIDGRDKSGFLIFDCCDNFDYFEKNPNGRESGIQKTLQHRLFMLQAGIAMFLQTSSDVDDIAVRTDFVSELVDKVNAIEKDIFPASMHRKYIDSFDKPEKWQNLTSVLLGELDEHIARYTLSVGSDARPFRFDALMYAVESAQIQQMDAPAAVRNLQAFAKNLLTLQNIPDIEQKSHLLKSILDTGYLDKQNLKQLESLREELRDLAVYLEPKHIQHVFTNFEDELTVKPKRPAQSQPVPEAYDKRVMAYINAHKDEGVIGKIHRNEPLNDDDLDGLEGELIKMGNREDYLNLLGGTSLGQFVRNIIGLDRKAIQEMFGQWLNDRNMNAQQLAFVRWVVDYVVANNGAVEKKTVFIEKPGPFSSLDLVKTFSAVDLQGLAATLDTLANNIRPHS